ncbi:hypothetical protein [Abyssisolibacter fermentans]|uniref:hypothetical protein n=1 Tax=Abyssisolibacter fermentans TaxID=1766203 RepID=UPI00138F7248|nr:hypothetical protein [Abyssisolibacter fermentans]
MSSELKSMILCESLTPMKSGIGDSLISIPSGYKIPIKWRAYQLGMPSKVNLYVPQTTSE